VYDGLVPYTELDLIIDSLAAHRLTRLAVEDVITEPIREMVFEKFPPHPRSLSYALTCPHCAGVWVGAGIVAARLLAPRAWRVAAVGLATASVVSLIQDYQERA
jgi:hypothetical protein